MLAHAMPGPVETAISRASDQTGVDAAFLLGEAQRESRFDPKALAPTSSASGLFQFIDQTWLATLKRHGSQFGYARYAGLIRQSPDGRYVTDDATARAAVMSLRLDPRAASLMAGEMAADHAAWLNQKMGRPPTAGELYAAHFLGREGAAQLVELATLSPGANASQVFPGSGQGQSEPVPQGRPTGQRGRALRRTHRAAPGLRRPRPRGDPDRSVPALRRGEASRANPRPSRGLHRRPGPPATSGEGTGDRAAGRRARRSGPIRCADAAGRNAVAAYLSARDE